MVKRQLTARKYKQAAYPDGTGTGEEEKIGESLMEELNLEKEKVSNFLKREDYQQYY